ncbi:MAG: hypothetical protein RLZZ241_1982 [Bacteroidota bacterium]|jgi:tricorn protease-like protein
MGHQNFVSRKSFVTVTLVPLLMLLLCDWGYSQVHSEIYLSKIDIGENNLKINAPFNISQNLGYDNQPSFDPNTGVLYYASNRNEQTDIAWYDPESGHSGWFVNTPGRSEYSPLRIPGSADFSAVGLDTAGLQRLYRYNEDISEVLIPNLKVGYQLWIDSDLLACTVLVANQMDLVLIKFEMEQRIIEKHVGRSLHKIPGTHAISFTKPTETGIDVYRLDLDTGKTTRLTTLPKGVQDMCWTPDGSILCGGNNVLHQFNPGKDPNWQIAHRFNSNFGKISRLTLNHSGNLLALVVE